MGKLTLAVLRKATAYETEPLENVQELSLSNLELQEIGELGRAAAVIKVRTCL